MDPDKSRPRRLVGHERRRPPMRRTSPVGSEASASKPPKRKTGPPPKTDSARRIPVRKPLQKASPIGSDAPKTAQQTAPPKTEAKSVGKGRPKKASPANSAASSNAENKDGVTLEINRDVPEPFPSQTFLAGAILDDSGKPLAATHPSMIVCASYIGVDPMGYLIKRPIIATTVTPGYTAHPYRLRIVKTGRAGYTCAGCGTRPCSCDVKRIVYTDPRRAFDPVRTAALMPQTMPLFDKDRLNAILARGLANQLAIAASVDFKSGQPVCEQRVAPNPWEYSVQFYG